MFIKVIVNKNAINTPDKLSKIRCLPLKFMDFIFIFYIFPINH